MREKRSATVLPPISSRMKDVLGDDQYGMGKSDNLTGVTVSNVVGASNTAPASTVPNSTSAVNVFGGTSVSHLDHHSSLEESELRKLRKENKQLVEELSHVSRTPRDEVFERQRVAKVKNLVVRLQLDFNNARHEFECRRKTLATLKSKLLETAMLTEDRGESAGIVEEGKPSVNEQHDVAMKKVQEVEERLATSDYTNKTYEHILRRYDKERQGMENAYLQMKTSLNRLSKSHAEMEIGIKVKKHEESSLYIRMSGMVMEMEEMRLKRDRMLNQTKNRVSEQAELHKYMSDRDYNRAGIAKEAQGDLDEHGERVLQDRMMAVHTKKMQTKNARYHVKKVEANIRRSIGGDADDVDSQTLMNRLENIQLTKNEAEQKVQLAEERRAEKEEELLMLQQVLTELQTSGVDLSYRRAVYDDIEKRMTSSEKRCAQYKRKFENLLNKLLPLYNGLEMLNAKLDTSSVLKVKSTSGNVNVSSKGAAKDSGDDGDKGTGGDKGGSSGNVGKESAGESSGQEESAEYSKYFEQIEALESQMTSIVDGLESMGATSDSSLSSMQALPSSRQQGASDDLMSNNVRVPINRGSVSVRSQNDDDDDDDDDEDEERHIKEEERDDETLE